MAVIEVETVYGKVIAKPMRLVDIHDVPLIADEESINNSGESNSDETKISEVAPEATPSPTEDSSVEDPIDTPTEKQ